MDNTIVKEEVCSFRDEDINAVEHTTTESRVHDNEIKGVVVDRGPARTTSVVENTGEADHETDESRMEVSDINNYILRDQPIQCQRYKITFYSLCVCFSIHQN